MGDCMKLSFKKSKTFDEIDSYLLSFKLLDSTSLRLSNELSAFLSVKSTIDFEIFKSLWSLKDQEKIEKLLKMNKPYTQIVELKEQKTFKLIYLPKSSHGYLIYLPELNQYKKEISHLEQMIKKQETYLYEMSHEIKTPLSSLTSYIDLFEKEALTPTQKNYIHNMSNALDQGLHQLDNILQLSKLSYQKPVLSKDIISIKQLIESMSDMFDAELKKKGLYLHVTHQDYFVFASDLNFLKQILTNILSNAIKFTLSGGIDIETSISKVDEKHLLQISISDTGIGMTDEEQLNLFKVFSQAHKDISKTFGGTGLGLSISKALTTLLQGRIDVKSTYGAGTTFTITIPVELSDQIIEKKAEETYQLPDKDLSILVVEDNLLSRQATKKLLTQINLRVTTAINGKEAISKSLEFPYDLILMDVSMPVLDGFEASKAIREKDLKTPIIAMTANTYQDHVKKCIDHGMNDVLYKPFKAKQLYQIIYNYTHN